LLRIIYFEKTRDNHIAFLLGLFNFLKDTLNEIKKVFAPFKNVRFFYEKRLLQFSYKTN
jgi:hypothetical protein